MPQRHRSPVGRFLHHLPQTAKARDVVHLLVGLCLENPSSFCHFLLEEQSSEMSDSEAGGDTAKKGRGRPKKAAEPRSESKDSDEPKAKRGRGRPKGTAKKAKKASSSSSASSGKRGRGRPKKGDSKEKNSSDQGSGASDKDD